MFRYKTGSIGGGYCCCKGAIATFAAVQRRLGDSAARFAIFPFEGVGMVLAALKKLWMRLCRFFTTRKDRI